MAKDKYEKVGGGEYGIYRKKPTDWGSIIGGIIVAVVVLAIIGNLTG